MKKENYLDNRTPGERKEDRKIKATTTNDSEKDQSLTWEEAKQLEREIGLLMKNGVVEGDSRDWGKAFHSRETLLRYKANREYWKKIIHFLEKYKEQDASN